MRHSYLDRYSRLASPVHRLSIAVKLGGTLAVLIIIAASSPLSLTVSGVVAAFLTGIAIVSTIPWGFLLRRMILLELFAAGISILTLFQPDGAARFAGLLVKSTLSLFTIVLFSNTTPFSDLLDNLRRWNFPSLFITLLALLYRYLFLLVDESERMQRARRSRTFTATGFAHWRSLATVISQLFLRSIDRAERIFAAMSARGWR